MKKKKPTDATMRNIRASKKRDSALEKRVKRIELELQTLFKALLPNCDK